MFVSFVTRGIRIRFLDHVSRGLLIIVLCMGQIKNALGVNQLLYYLVVNVSKPMMDVSAQEPLENVSNAVIID